jgi:putative FmdB family regulatory protein
MPTYSYRCTECGTAFDIQQAFTDDSLTECPTCGGRLRKLFTAVGVSFNGSGFYRNDSRAAEKSGGTEKSTAAKDSGATSSSDSGSSTSGSSTSGSSTSAPNTSAPAKTAAPASKEPSG